MWERILLTDIDHIRFTFSNSNKKCGYIVIIKAILKDIFSIKIFNMKIILNIKIIQINNKKHKIPYHNLLLNLNLSYLYILYNIKKYFLIQNYIYYHKRKWKNIKLRSLIDS